MSIFKACLRFVMLMSILESAQLNRLLPRHWNKICKVKSGVTCLHPSTSKSIVSRMRELQPSCVSCEVGPDDIWNFHDLRSFLHKSNKTFAMNVHCHDEGNITLPFPIRAAGLKYFSVTNCLIVGYMSEYFDRTIDAIPDTLIYNSLADSTIYVDIMKMMEASNGMNNMTKAAKCGPEKSIAVSIARNISYAFSDLPESTLNDIFTTFTTRTSTKYIKGLLSSSHTCAYRKLTEMDLSLSNTRGANFDSILVNNAVYPALKTLDVSDSLLRRIPDKFNDWRLYFPRLTMLDLSHNYIQKFSTVLDYGNSSVEQSIGTINLQYNLISTIAMGELKSFTGHRFVKVDIRNNPIKCDCKMLDFIDFFSQPNELTKGGNASQYSYLRHLKCKEPLSLKGRTIVDLSREDIGC
ncbi:uncharacterized protein [Argopecten irradians]|uniref:uncharacterized protein n=1 Tax=Argopecten irradians TaxID=31199 RepID=UPI0037220A16